MVLSIKMVQCYKLPTFECHQHIFFNGAIFIMAGFKDSSSLREENGS